MFPPEASRMLMPEMSLPIFGQDVLAKLLPP